MRTSDVKIVSFSGIDGAGKSSHIEALCRQLENSGLHYSVLSFWDDVVAFGRLREQMSLKAFKGDKGVGSPDKPISRCDKNVSTWYLTPLRMMLYTLDATRLRIIVSRMMRSSTSFVIFDRYIYDELANLPLERASVRLYVRVLQRLLPRPDIAFLIDADPSAAVVRKPEYPLKFVRRNRENYLTLSRIVGRMTIIPALSLVQAIALMKRHIAEKIGASADVPSVFLPHPRALSRVAKTPNP
jgi:thymidylate kinase